MEKEREQLQRCLEKEPPFCSVACPFHYDVRDLIARLQKGGFSGAYRSFANAVAFPRLVAKLCTGPCRSGCPRTKTDAAVDLPKLERSLAALSTHIKPNCYNMPAKKGRFAIIGAGPSGLACALRLCNKKYQVSIYEQSDAVGGSLRKLLSAAEIEDAVLWEFQFEHFELLTNRSVRSLSDLDGEFDGVYIATGEGGADFGQLEAGTPGPQPGRQGGVYLGGGLLGCDTMEAIAQGIQAARLLDAYLQTGRMEAPQPQPTTHIKLDPESLSFSEPVQSEGLYTKEQCRAEASRCLSCRCDSCVRHCPMMKYFGKFPRRIEEEVQVTITPGTLDGNGTVATRLISTCSQCGLCEKVCPQNINMGQFMNWSHRQMQPKITWPWVFHEFFLEDMEQANRDGGLLATPTSAPKLLFFPGCQLGAADPRYVTAAYRWLRQAEPDTAILLSCCGAPAAWGADEKAAAANSERIRAHWQSLGQPLVITACPSCRQTLARLLPELPTKMLVDVLVEKGFCPDTQDRGAYAVFDPCALRDEASTCQNVRQLALAAGYSLQELDYYGERAQCCSYGGQIARTDPKYHNWLQEQRAAASPLPYLTSCVNCLRSFRSQGKDCEYILGLLPGAEDAQPTLDLNEARRNRLLTRQAVLDEFFPESAANEALPLPGSRLLISPELQAKLNREYITEEAIVAVIERCEHSGRKIVDTQSGHFFGSAQVGHATYWAEYTPQQEFYVLHNAYTHRMKAQEE